MELFASWGLKHWVGLLAMIAVFCFAGRYEYLRHQVTKDQTTIANQKVTIAAQDIAITNVKAAAKLDEQVQVATQQEVKKVTQRHETIQRKVEARVRQIEQHYVESPASPDNVIAESQQLSNARIDGLWEAYCATKPDDTSCQPTYTNPGEPHA
jgi:cobalamin biosynthesis protein CbiD